MFESDQRLTETAMLTQMID